MGHEIVYCFKCATRVTSAELDKGRGAKLGARVACGKCLPNLLASKPPERPQPANRGKATTKHVTVSATASSATRRTARSTSQVEAGHPPPKKSPWLIIGMAGGVLALAVVLVILLASGDEEQKAPVALTPDKPVVQKSTKPPKEDPRLRKAEEAVKKAAAVVNEHPDDLAAQIKAYEEAVEATDLTTLANDTRKTLEALCRKRDAKITEAFEELRKGIAPAVEKEDFGKALMALRDAADRFSHQDWKFLIDGQVKTIGDRVVGKAGPIADRAILHKRKGELSKVAELRKLVAGWGMDRAIADFDARLKDVEAPSPELLAYRATWREAMPRVGARDFEAAMNDLGRETEEAAKNEAAADLKDLAGILALYKEAVTHLATWPKGDDLEVEVRDGAGAKKQISGRLISRGPTRGKFEIEDEKIAFVEWTDVTAASLASILELRRETPLTKNDRRLLTLFCLLEGETEAVPSIDSVPKKFREYAKTAAKRIPRVPVHEAEARELFYAAETEYRSMEQLGPAIKKYKRLLDEYAGTKVVSGEIKSVMRRSEEGAEYFWSQRDLEGAGTFQEMENPLVGKCWTSVRDTPDPDEAAGNFVDVEYYSLPEKEYGAWVYAGGCCQETFAVYYQATGLTTANPKRRKERLPVEPGGGYALPLKIRGQYLKRTHAQHGGQKKPSKWLWIQVPLPKEQTEGYKKIRLLTDQEGFSVAFALITSLRKKPFTDKELEKMAKIDTERAERAEKAGKGKPDKTKDVLIADFEGNNYGNWKTTGQAFGTGPARGTLGGQMAVSGFRGIGLVNSFIRGDGPTGTLTSPPFKVNRRYLKFLVGGGAHAKTSITLVLAGKVVRTQSGPNAVPGGTEALDWKFWDLADLQGKTVQIQIVDQVSGGWGHVNVDHIVMSQKSDPVPN